MHNDLYILISHFQPKVGEIKQPSHTPTLVNYQKLLQKYVGNDKEAADRLLQTFSPNESGVGTCVLIVQGHVFRGRLCDVG